MNFRPDPGETVLYRRHPSWRSAVGRCLAGLLAGAVPAVVLLLLGAPWLWLVILPAVGLAVAGLTAILRRKSTVFTVTDQRLRIRRGLLAPDVQQTRVERVRSATLRRSVTDRLLGIGSVEIDTGASDQETALSFNGVARPAELMELVGEVAGNGPDPGPGRG